MPCRSARTGPIEVSWTVTAGGYFGAFCRYVPCHPGISSPGRRRRRRSGLKVYRGLPWNAHCLMPPPRSTNDQPRPTWAKSGAIIGDHNSAQSPLHREGPVPSLSDVYTDICLSVVSSRPSAVVTTVNPGGTEDAGPIGVRSSPPVRPLL